MLKFNENNEVIREEEYKAILVGVSLGEDISYSMEELKGLAEADNIEVLGMMVQNLEKKNTATLIGKGKVSELKELAENMEADTVIFNEELTGMQLRNLEEEIGVRVIDRTILILDIFADRASSSEGKLQVEMAQLKYRMPRLTGFGKSLSRLGGGIGTRGPGEKKLETDRRHIERRLLEIKSELDRIKKNRGVQKKLRAKREIPVVALVGYTNSGKSALMNRILSKTEKDERSVFEENMLFATLDTFERSVRLDNNHHFILVDTVGFVSKLPHALVEAFKATLEVVSDAELLIHVVDASYENYAFQIDVTERVLDEIGAGDRKKITAYNKIDLIKDEASLIVTEHGSESFLISAKYDKGIDELLECIGTHIFKDRVRTTLLIPYSRGEVVSRIMNEGQVFSIDCEEGGTLIDAEIKLSDYNRYKEFEADGSIIQHRYGERRGGTDN